MAGQQTIDSNSLNGIAHRNEQESPQSCNSEGFHFATWNLTTFLSCYYHMLLPVKSQLKTSRSSPYFLAFVIKTSQNHISESTHISRNGLKSTLSRLHSINTLLSFFKINQGEHSKIPCPVGIISGQGISVYIIGFSLIRIELYYHW